eukprot:TRINITY_DN6192_c0_g1_i1.p1 TRINITY_DN6192_c0_g1~~TRINITY_DN6192_c0_g1_i1.p1  ORF type:complete len:87 (-),score=21.49 TRINITY_DN6192_c0_g1_i1:84-344(-)
MCRFVCQYTAVSGDGHEVVTTDNETVNVVGNLSPPDTPFIELTGRVDAQGVFACDNVAPVDGTFSLEIYNKFLELTQHEKTKGLYV